MINEFENELWFMLMVMDIWFCYLFLLTWVGINLYPSNEVLIKFNQLNFFYHSQLINISLLFPFMLYYSPYLLSTNHKNIQN
jgi:hypothetical protein